MKIDNLKDFVEKVDQAKKDNPADLSMDQDLSIAIMNLISIEEHFFFTGAKTGKEKYYRMIEEIRDIRKGLLQKIVGDDYEGEIWCISKHLLAASMRLMEVGTKQQTRKDFVGTNEMFEKAYDLYCLFWALNIKKDDEIKHLAQKNLKKSDIANDIIKPNKNESLDVKIEEKSMMTGVRNLIGKILNCCKE